MALRLSGVEYWAMPKGVSSGLVRPVRWVVLHATANTASARAEAKYAATRTDDRSRWTSAHFYVDSQEIIGSVPLDMRAWAAYSEANGHGWHIEMCGLSDRVPAAVIARTAGLVARLCELDNVPVRHCTPSMVAALQRGITGHADITEGLNVGSHTDPGPHFAWSQFLAMVQQPTTEGGFLMALSDAQQAEIYDVCHALNGTPPWAPKGFTRLRMLETLYYTQVLGGSGTDTTWLAAQFRALLEAVKTVPGIDPDRVDAIEAELVAAVSQANRTAVADALRAGADAAEQA